MEDTRWNPAGNSWMSACHSHLREAPDFLARTRFSQPQNVRNKWPQVPGFLPRPQPAHLTLNKRKTLTDRRVGSRPGSLAGELPNSPAGGPHYLLCLRDASILPLTAIKFERLKYCLRRKAKYLPMCLQVLSVCWAFVNTGAIWAPNTCAQNVGFPTQTGFPAKDGGR